MFVILTFDLLVTLLFGYFQTRWLIPHSLYTFDRVIQFSNFQR